MIPEFEDSVFTADQALFHIASMSPQARDSLEKESFRESAESDGSTEQYILEDAFSCLIKDLESIGITVNIDYSDVVENMGALASFLNLCTYLLPDPVYHKLKTDQRLRDCVEHILSGNLGDNETLLQTYLSELGGLDGQIPLHPEMTSVCDHYYPVLSQTEALTDCFKNIIDLLADEKMTPESDSQKQINYTTVIRNIIGKLSDAINTYTGQYCYEDLCALQNYIIKDFISPDNFTEYSYLFLEDENSLPEALHENFNKKHYVYQVSHAWCPEYYLVRGIGISDVRKPILVCFLYAMAQSKEEFVTALSKWNTQFRDTMIEDHVLKLYTPEFVHG